MDGYIKIDNVDFEGDGTLVSVLFNKELISDIQVTPLHPQCVNITMASGKVCMADMPFDKITKMLKPEIFWKTTLSPCKSCPDNVRIALNLRHVAKIQKIRGGDRSKVTMMNKKVYRIEETPCEMLETAMARRNDNRAKQNKTRNSKS